MSLVVKGFHGTSRLVCAAFPGIDAFHRCEYPSVSVVSAHTPTEMISLNDPDMRDDRRRKGRSWQRVSEGMFGEKEFDHFEIWERPVVLSEVKTPPFTTSFHHKQ
jgi:hypothetical protein